jgi:hypothetical protein
VLHQAAQHERARNNSRGVPGATTYILMPLLIISIIIFVAIIRGYKDNLKQKYFMVNLTSKLFKSFYNLSLWLIVICFTIGGGLLGVVYGNGFNIIRFLMCAFIGFTFGLAFVIIVGGLITIFLDMHQKLLNMDSIIQKYNKVIQKDSIQNLEIKNTKCKINSKLSIYEKPDYNSKIICQLLVGENVEIIEAQDVRDSIWCKIRDNDNNEGWCEKNQIE